MTKLIVTRRDGVQETIDLTLPVNFAPDAKGSVAGLKLVDANGIRHYFDSDGSYSGSMTPLPPGTTAEQARMIGAALGKEPGQPDHKKKPN
jgi:hypothetical protein